MSENETWTQAELLAHLPAGVDAAGRAMVARAWRLAEACHRCQKRDEGTPYFIHPVGVCRILIESAGVADPEVLAAALLHDAAEDSPLLPEDLEAFLTPGVGRMVGALTKEKGDDAGKDARSRAYLERVAAADLPTRLIKIADRLDNTSRLHLSPQPDKQRRYWEETRAHYLPLAAATHPELHRRLAEWVRSFAQTLGAE